MNWFQRYGIPGAYFIVLTVAWIYALSGMELEKIEELQFNILISLAVITFIPIGYIISILQQVLYYIIPFLGMHRAAKKKSSLNLAGDPKFEPIVEAYSVLLVVDKRISLDMHQYFRDWIRRRMDVVAINFSLFIATLLAFIIPFLITRYYLKSNILYNNTVEILLLVSVVVIIITILSMVVLHLQIRTLITEIYKIIK